jgi:histidyl-tRNA synthetase
MSQLRSIKGTHDILPEHSNKWQDLEKIIHETCKRSGYREIRTPIFEDTRVFSRGVGEDSDIVSKEMYSWEDRDGTSLTLRPELTASVVRSYIQHNLGILSPIQRMYYMGPLFRRERPQKGRQRQFNQFGIEAFGSENPELDAEVISIAWNILEGCDLGEISTLQLNSIGSTECRNNYKEALKDFLRPNLNQLSDTSKNRFETNPLRILDTKSENERRLLEKAPLISDYYTDEDRAHFDSLQQFLSVMNISFIINPKLVRGLDYYSRTVFEFTSSALGSQDALLGGGRYDRLVEMLGGKPTPAIGFAAGIERFLIARESLGETIRPLNNNAYFVCLGEAGIPDVLSLSNTLRKAKINVVSDPLRRSLKSQMREANKSGSRFAIILGTNEIENKTLVIKDLKKGEQKIILQSDLTKFFKDLTS